MPKRLKFRQSDRKKKRIKRNTINMTLELSESTLAGVEEFMKDKDISFNQALVILLTNAMKAHTKRVRSRKKKALRNKELSDG